MDSPIVNAERLDSGSVQCRLRCSRALLEAAVEEYYATARAAALEFTDAQVDDPRTLASTVGRWVLARLDDRRQISHMLEREGNRLPALRDSFRAGTDAGFGAAAMVVEQWVLGHHPHLDADTLGVILLGGLVNFRRSAWTLGAPPLGLDDERFLDGLATLFALAGARGSTAPPGPRRAGADSADRRTDPRS